MNNRAHQAEFKGRKHFYAKFPFQTSERPSAVPGYGTASFRVLFLDPNL